MAYNGAAGLRQLLADTREEAKIVDRNKGTFPVSRVEDLLKQIEGTVEDLLRFVSESDALLRGAKRAFLRRNFAAWEADGFARRLPNGTREYCPIVLPRVTPASLAREAGRRGELPPDARKAG